MSSNFNNILKQRFKGKNVSEIARELDIPKSILHDWLSAKRQPSLKNVDYLKRLSQYLGLTLDQLIFADESREAKVISSITFQDENRSYKLKIERIK